MGISFSNPVGDDKQAEIKELIEAVLKTFTLQYTKAYGIELLKKIKADVQAEPPSWQLLERPSGSFKKPLKTGYLTKQGAVRKSWLRRFFVVRADYKIEYYEDEEIYNKGGKPKGTISPCGYTVSRDLDKDLLSRAQEIAEKMGIDASDIPAIPKYPNFAFEIHHHRRRCYFIHAEKEEEKDEWVKVFKQCCRHCYGFNNPDPVAQAAFRQAIRRTRWELGRWGYWTYGGSEEQVLSDLIVDELNWTVMKDVYYNIKGPYAIRMTIRNKVLQTLDTFVSAAVTPAYKAMETAVKALRGRVEGMIREKIEPIFGAEKEIKEKIKNAVVETVSPVLSERVSPRLAGIVQILTSPMSEAFQETRNLFDEKVAHLARKVKDNNGFGDKMEHYFHDLDNAPQIIYVMSDAYKKVDVMHDPLWALRQFFDEIEPWSLIWTAHDLLKRVLDNAMYTFEKELQDEGEQTNLKTDSGAAEAAILKVKESVQERFAHDASDATTEYYKDIMLSIVKPFLLKIVNPLTKPLLEPINNAVPDAFKEIIDVEEMFESVVEGIVGDSISKVIEHVTSS
ncbi:PH domain-containing protein DDB_G0267786-like [Oscarella lobularis]|uniref:PH domain-containing protein DDB_G0267786-like n=1 Tax=Oscarella lobularis TaxID=121494 RepID=UPI003313575E